VDQLCADASRAREVLGWEPKIGFEELVAMMVDADMALLSTPGAARGEPIRGESW
jgi:GDPmannose 4,6-dehydratase